MMGKTIKLVVAVGGNALEEKGLPPTAQSQREVVAKTAEYLAQMSKDGYEMAIVHGNGPQVGRILLASEAAKEVTPVLPLDVCGAMSQGYIGYHIQQAMRESLAKRGRNVPVVTVATQVLVDEKDPAFHNPTKPIGPFYTKEEADKLAKEKGYTMKEDAGRGYRRMVPSPKPKRIVEVDAIKRLWDTTITVCCGGGGVPIIEKDGVWYGVEGVIDKDLAAAELAQELEADILLILTEVEQVAINWNKPNQKNLAEVSVAEMEEYIQEGHFAPGSMLPKVEAALEFVRSGGNRIAVISSLKEASRALKGETGTRITR